jgi:hypothetical protein
MSDFPLTLAIGLAVVVPLVLARAYARIADDVVDEWAQARGLALAPEHRPVVASYLRGARIRRTWGVVAGLLLPSVVELAFTGRLQVLGFGTDGESAPYAGPIWAFLGYLLGAVYAEVSLARPLDPVRRSASLVPRRLEDYLPPRLLRAQRALGVAVVLGIVAAGLVPYPSSFATPDWFGLAGGGAFFAAFAVGLEALERWLVRRRQPFTSPSLVAIDDAIRAQAVHALAGSGLALLLVACSGVCAVLAASDVALLRWTMWLPALVLLLLALRACLEIGQQAWPVRRRVDRRAGAAPA